MIIYITHLYQYKQCIYAFCVVIDEEPASVAGVDHVYGPSFRKSFSTKEKQELVQTMDLMIVSK